MKKFFLCCALVPFTATGALAQQSEAMTIALSTVPEPCDDYDNIADAAFVRTDDGQILLNEAGQRTIRVTCKGRGLFARQGAPATNAAAPAGAPATNFVPLLGGLGPLLGVGAVGAALAAGAAGGGSTTPDTN